MSTISHSRFVPGPIAIRPAPLRPIHRLSRPAHQQSKRSNLKKTLLNHDQANALRMPSCPRDCEALNQRFEPALVANVLLPIQAIGPEPVITILITPLSSS